MIKDLLFAKTPLPTLGRGLDALHLRQRSIATNIANAQSSKYTRKVVDFEDQLRTALSRPTSRLTCSHPDHLPLRNSKQGVYAQLRDANDRIDGPGSTQVVIEREMANLAQVQLKYEAEAKLARQYFELLNSAIRGIV